MKTREENYMSMARAVAHTVSKHKNEWAGLPRFTVYAAKLDEIIAHIDSKKEQAEILSTGATLDKAAASEHALHLGQKLSQRAMAYAEDQRMYELRNQLKLNMHSLLSHHGSEILDKLRNLENQLKAILLQLPDYGVTQQHMDEFIQATDEYEKLLVHPRENIVERKSHNETLGDYMKLLRLLFTNMDRLVNAFEYTDFEREYRNGRVIVNLGSRHKPSVSPTPETKPS